MHVYMYVCMHVSHVECKTEKGYGLSGRVNVFLSLASRLLCCLPATTCWHRPYIHDVVLVTFFIRTDVAVDEGVNLVKNLTSSSLFSSQKDITNLVFYGDSISSQLVQALVCDLLRAGDYWLLWWCFEPDHNAIPIMLLSNASLAVWVGVACFSLISFTLLASLYLHLSLFLSLCPVQEPNIHLVPI